MDYSLIKIFHTWLPVLVNIIKSINTINYLYNFNIINIFADGLIGDNAIIEIKCPYSVKDYLHIRDAIVDKKVSISETIIHNNTVYTF